MVPEPPKDNKSSTPLCKQYLHIITHVHLSAYFKSSLDYVDIKCNAHGIETVIILCCLGENDKKKYACVQYRCDFF